MKIEAYDNLSELDSDQVATYLTQHPNFFVGRDSLLANMRLKHERAGTVSLIERQVSVLRECSKTDQDTLVEYIAIAKHNYDIFKKSQYMILGLIEAADPKAFFINLERGLKRDFKSHLYRLIIFRDQPRLINHFINIVPTDSASTHINSLMKRKKPFLGKLKPLQQEFLFGQQSDQVKSAIVLPIRQRRDQIALLAIGSNNINDFQPGMDTLFVSFIAEVLARLLPRHVE